NFKLGLRGTIRMETPVIYFYSPRKMTVSVRVAFSKGIITEWYPHAAAVQPSRMLPTAKLSHLQKDGSILVERCCRLSRLDRQISRGRSAQSLLRGTRHPFVAVA